MERISGLTGEFCIGVDFLNLVPDRSIWLLVKFVDAVFRGVSEVCFCSHPVTGLLMTFGLALAEDGGYLIALSALISAAISIFSSLLFDQPKNTIRNGIGQFNAVLVGSVISSMYLSAPFGGETLLTFRPWFFIVIGSILTVPVQSSIGNILQALNTEFQVETHTETEQLNSEIAGVAEETINNGSVDNSMKKVRLGLVGLTFPFNVVTFVLLSCLFQLSKQTQDLSSTQINVKFINNSDEIDIDTVEVVKGVVLSIGQVFAVRTLNGSILMYIGLLICSPILCVMSIIGATIGTVSGLFLTSPPYDLVYIGVWGYNSLLTCSGLGGLFFVLSWQTLVKAILASFFSSAIQRAIASSLSQAGLPVLTIPFVLSTWIFLLVTTVSSTSATRVSQVSSPEAHLFNHVARLKKQAMLLKLDIERQEDAETMVFGKEYNQKKIIEKAHLESVENSPTVLVD